jgi:hypothetical protein
MTLGLYLSPAYPKTTEEQKSGNKFKEPNKNSVSD